MQLKDVLTWSLLAIANPVVGRFLPISARDIQARALPGLPSDDELKGTYGLKDDSWPRKFYDAFIKFEQDEVGDSKGLDNYWAFWCGPNVEDLGKFVDAFNNDGKYHEGLEDGDDKQITIPGNVYGDVESKEDLQKVQSDWVDDNEDAIEKAVTMPIAMMSWRGAQRAANVGGIVRYLGEKGKEDLEANRIWSTVEAYELTKEGTNVESIQRYDQGVDGQPKEIWKKGNQPLGQAVNWESWFVDESTAKKELGEDKHEEVKDEVEDEAD